MDLKPCPACGGKLVRTAASGPTGYGRSTTQESFACESCPWFIVGPERTPNR